MTTPSEITIAIDEWGIRTTEADHTPEYTLLKRPVPQIVESCEVQQADGWRDWRDICDRTGYQPITIREVAPVRAGVRYNLAHLSPAAAGKRAPYLNRDTRDTLVALVFTLAGIAGIAMLAWWICYGS